MAGLVFQTLAGAPSARAGAWTHGRSDCTGKKENPQNLRFENMYGKETVLSSQTGVAIDFDPAANWWLARDIGEGLWSGGSGISSPSYFLFAPDNGGCRDQSGYNTSSLFNGYHVRYWEGTSSPRVMRSAHHDFWCSSNPPHAANNYPKAARRVAQYFKSWSDFEGGSPDFSFYKVTERSPSSGKNCGRSWSDDGITYVVQQLTAKIHTLVVI